MPLGLYVHFPFCSCQCSYCDFYKELYESGLEEQFYEALTIETELAAAQYAQCHTEVSSIYIGGGTPSLTTLCHYAGWMEHLKRYFKVPEGVELTVEFNPESTTLENLTAFKELGVNRPVFGIQTFNNYLLKILNRAHNPHYCFRAIYYTNALGYTNFGADLIFGLPKQTSKILAADVDQLLDLDPPHISFYQLALKPGTKLAAKVASGSLKMPNPELTMAMYRGGCERIVEAGYVRYEVSSFAKPGYECKHNLSYWEGNDFLGLGPSAHSLINGKYHANISNLHTYIDKLKAGKLPRVLDETGVEHRMSEAIMLGLRTSRGISRSQFSQRFGVPIETRFNRGQYRMLVESGHLLPDKDMLRLSDEGIMLAEEITRRLIE